jgi:glutaredoxin-like protein NrdH
MSNNLIENGEKMITVYTKPACVQCDATKRLMDKLNLEYTTVDITEDAEAFGMLVSKGFQAAPVVNAGDDWWAGFNPEKINGLVA